MSELSAQSPVERATQCSGVGGRRSRPSIACPLSAQLRSSTRHFALECVWRSEMRIMRNDHTINNTIYTPRPHPARRAPNTRGYYAAAIHRAPTAPSTAPASLALTRVADVKRRVLGLGRGSRVRSRGTTRPER